jgi:peptidoglycan/LPS O-acetylase OafA/YrhL
VSDAQVPVVPRMGYQPSLDGVRALAVIAVLLYHAGFSWLHGGFFGVEVFFVVSGFLITSLLIEERATAGSVDLRLFWVRRFRRLLPALVAMLVVVGLWAMVWGTAEQHTQMRRDYPWAALYSFNWGSIFSGGSYWGAGSPRLLRHLWSLAVEEQWYLLWPLAFVVMSRVRWQDRSKGVLLSVAVVLVMAATAVANVVGWPTRILDPVGLRLQQVDTNNFLYLSTITRSSGLLLGAALAFLWRPWRATARTGDATRRWPDAVVAAAVVVLVFAFVVGSVPSDATYRVLLPMVTVASAALVAALVHPAAVWSRVVFGARPMVGIGRRSYGLYLWSWPISLVAGATEGSVWRFVLAMAITAPSAEVCYRWIETPIRRGALGEWWKAHGRRRRMPVAVAALASLTLLVGGMGSFYASADEVFDPAKDTSVVEFDARAAPVLSLPIAPTTDSPPTTGAPPATDASSGSTVSASTAPPTTAPPTTVAPLTLPRRIVIVGDSTAHSLAVNMPSGIEDFFTIGDGSVEGCSVYDSGLAMSARDGYRRPFDGCDGWERRWVRAATKVKAELALVVIGAWDVFDVELDGQTLPFGTAANDLRFVTGLQQGIDAMAAEGVTTVLLEIPCMRPQDVKGQGTPALPERGDDARVAHLNALLWQLALANPTTTRFVSGPAEYCSDPAISVSREYRWDGVHAYRLGATLTMETIAGALLAIPVP